MRKLLLILSLILSFSTFAQETIAPKEFVETEFDKAAEFPGGLNAFRNEFAKNFDSKKLEGKGQINTQITFIVDEKGILSEIKAKGTNITFNKESVDAIKKIKSKWIPAMYNGHPVKSKYNFPLTMNFMN